MVLVRPRPPAHAADDQRSARGAARRGGARPPLFPSLGPRTRGAGTLRRPSSPTHPETPIHDPSLSFLEGGEKKKRNEATTPTTPDGSRRPRALHPARRQPSNHDLSPTKPGSKIRWFTTVTVLVLVLVLQRGWWK